MTSRRMTQLGSRVSMRASQLLVLDQKFGITFTQTLENVYICNFELAPAFSNVVCRPGHQHLLLSKD